MKKALVMYASITGNTEKIGFAFKEALEEMGWSVDTCKLTNKTNFNDDPIFLDEYDLFFLGSPIMAGLPSTLLGKNLGLTQSIPPRMYSDRIIMPGLKRPETDDYTPYAVVYATYGGASTGPKECLATLEIEKLYLDNLYMQTIGQFACLGTEAHHAAVDTVADKIGQSVDLASDTLQRFKDNPNAEEFKNMPPHILGELRAAAGMGEGGPIHSAEEILAMDKTGKGTKGAPGGRPGGPGGPPPDMVMDENSMHVMNREPRPNADDIEAAKIFVRNLVKCYFYENGGRRRHGGELISIS